MAHKDPGRGANGRFVPGHQRNGGRRKGKKNKLTLDIREALLAAGAELGGREGLIGFFKQAGRKDPIALAGWLADLIPRERPVKVDESTGEPFENPHMTINVIGVAPGTFLSKAEIEEIERAEMPMLLEHEPAPALVDSDDDSEEPPKAD